MPAGDLEGYDEGWDELVRATPREVPPGKLETPETVGGVPAKSGLVGAGHELGKRQRVLSISGRDFMDVVSYDSGTEEKPGTALWSKEREGRLNDLGLRPYRLTTRLHGSRRQ